MTQETSPEHVYTLGHDEPVLRSHRSRTAQNSAFYLLPQLRPGMSLLDVGCGAGTITVDLANIVAPGIVTAMETTEAELAFARAEVAARKCPNVVFAAGDVHDLEFADNYFDVVHAHQVLQHVHDPVRALREMVRVCKPGGTVAVRDTDYSAWAWFPADAHLDQWRDLYVSAARSNGGEPDAGRRLLAWAHAAGCRNVTTTTSTWCYADPDSRRAWGDAWADRIVNSRIATQLLNDGVATPSDLQRISAAWRGWAEHDDGWISILHTEILISV